MGGREEERGERESFEDQSLRLGRFDALAAEYGVHALDTIGDAYLAATNLNGDQVEKGIHASTITGTHASTCSHTRTPAHPQIRVQARAQAHTNTRRSDQGTVCIAIRCIMLILLNREVMRKGRGGGHGDE